MKNIYAKIQRRYESIVRTLARGTDYALCHLGIGVNERVANALKKGKEYGFHRHPHIQQVYFDLVFGERNNPRVLCTSLRALEEALAGIPQPATEEARTD
jgi:hypothetical protein